MMNLNCPDLEFRTYSQVKAYSTFWLGANPLEIPNDLTPEEINDINFRRETKLNAQLDYFKNIDFSKANRSNVSGIYSKLCRKLIKTPLSSAGSRVASSRFNFKNNAYFNNRVIYLGKTKLGCEIELFHLEEHREKIRKKYVTGYWIPTDDDFVLPEYTLYEYEINFENILVLTSKSCCDAVNINLATIQNEWFDLNDEYSIPSSSQILGTLARCKGYNGILYKSVRNQLENNLVLFEENTNELLNRPLKAIAYIPSEEIIRVE